MGKKSNEKWFINYGKYIDVNCLESKREESLQIKILQPATIFPFIEKNIVVMLKFANHLHFYVWI